jgi:hypothetical protein
MLEVTPDQILANLLVKKQSVKSRFYLLDLIDKNIWLESESYPDTGGD